MKQFDLAYHYNEATQQDIQEYIIEYTSAFAKISGYVPLKQLLERELVHQQFVVEVMPKVDSVQKRLKQYQIDRKIIIPAFLVLGLLFGIYVGEQLIIEKHKTFIDNYESQTKNIITNVIDKAKQNNNNLEQTFTEIINNATILEFIMFKIGKFMNKQ